MKNKKGFTLVELIVVLAILAVLAGLLVPALTGYIDKAKNRKHMLEAKRCMTAFQTVVTEMYAQGFYPSEFGEAQGIDIFWTVSNNDGTKYAKEVLTLAECDPHLLIIGAGAPKYKNQPEKICKIGFVVYWPDEKSDVIFFDGEKWTNDYPWVKVKDNNFIVDGEKIELQMFIVKTYKTNKKDINFWDEMKKHVEITGHLVQEKK